MTLRYGIACSWLARTAPFLYVLALTSQSLLAAADGMTGRVVDRLGRVPIGGASVYVPSQKKGTITASDGTYRLSGLPVGENVVVVRSIGFTPDTIVVRLDSGTIRRLDVDLERAFTTGKEISVVGDALSGQARALSQQKALTTVTNVVSSDQIGRFPDANIGDAMKRITGVTVQYDQGEARFGLIRGTAGALNSVMINGERIPSAEAESRTVQLDLIPADMIQTIELNKTITPDMDADAIGGAVNLVTRASAAGNRVSATLGSGLNVLTGKPLVVGAVVASTRLLDDRLGVIGSASYNDHILGSDNIEAAWSQGDNGTFLEEFEIRQYDVRRIRRSTSLGLDYRFDNDNSVTMSAMVNHRDDWENRFRTTYEFSEGDSAVEITRERKGGPLDNINGGARLEDQRMYSVNLIGDHTVLGDWKLTWSATLAKASEERPNERYLAFKNENGRGTVGLADSSQPVIRLTSDSEELSSFEFDGFTEEVQYTEDIDRNGRIDLLVPVGSGVDRSSLKVGARLRTKEKSRSNSFTTFDRTDANTAFENAAGVETFDRSKDNFLAGPYSVGRFATNNTINTRLSDTAQWVGEPDLEEFAGANFNATERIIAGYGQWDQRLLDNRLQILAGLRVEQTTNDYTGNVFDVDEGAVQEVRNTRSYTNVLPSIHLRYAAREDLILRAAWTNTLARPNYYDLVPYAIIAREDGELQRGNPDLKATTSSNLDLLGEQYFESVGIVSAGVFFKSLSNFIFTYVEQDYRDPATSTEFEQFSQPRNGASATLFGAEVSLQRQLDFLPGALSGFGLYANYTFTTSSVSGLPLPGRESEHLGLAGNANHMVNASISYEWMGITARIAANYTSAYVDEYGESSFDDRFYDAQFFLDANAAYAITERIRIFVEANNLTNQPLRYYQGTVDRVAQAEFYNRRFTTGIKVDLQ